jgi:hypothetical protein
MAKAPREGVDVERPQPVHEEAPGSHHGAGETLDTALGSAGDHHREDRDEEQRHEQRREKGDDHRPRKGTEGLSDEAVEKEGGHQYREGRGVAGDDRRLDLPGSRQRRLEGRDRTVSVLVVAGDVLEDDDGCVDDHAHRQDDCRQGDQVHLDPEEHHAREGEEKGHRHRYGDDDAATDAAEKEKDDDRREDQRLPDGAEHIADDEFGEGGALVGNDKLDPRVAIADLREGVFQEADHLDGVGILLLEDLHRDGVVAVNPEAGEVVAGSHLDRGEITHENALTRRGRDRNRGDIGEGLTLLVNAKGILTTFAADLPGGEAHVVGGDRLDHRSEGQVVRVEAGAVDPDGEFRLVSTKDIDQGDPGNALDLRGYRLLGDGSHRRHVGAAHSHRHDGAVARRKLEHLGLGDRPGKGHPDAGDRVLDVNRRKIHRGVVPKLDGDEGESVLGRRGDALDPFEGRHLLFDRVGDEVRHVFGGGAGVRREHVDQRRGGVRKELNREVEVRENPEDHRGDEEGIYREAMLEGVV